MTKQKVLIIGNGPSIFELERGKEIDDFDGKIIRFNHYQIKGYEKYIGTRTDILILGQLNVKEQLEQQYDYILLYQTGLDGGAGLRKMKAVSPHNIVKFFPLQDKDKIKFALELTGIAEPTSGIVAMYWFNNPDTDLYIYGFDCSVIDCFSDNNASNIEKSKCHDQGKEAIYIEFLIDQNLIKRF